MKFRLIPLIIFVFLINTFVKSQEKPNVIVIMADDLGYGDVGFNGSTDIPTPNIDRIANGGVKFTNGYTTYSVCGPSRAGFITGRYQQRFGFERNPLYRVHDPNMGLPLDEMTIAESVTKVGYTSGIIGKWHLGAHIINHPLNRGFDEFYGHLGGGHRYFPEDLVIQDSYDVKDEPESYTSWILRNHTPEETDEYLTDEFSNEAVAFVDRHKKEPFFLFLSYNAPHTPLQAKDEDLAMFPDLEGKRKTYAAMVHAVDRGVGMVLDKLQELNIEENTIVYFLSDNGGPESKNASDNGVLRGKKGDVYEGGFRVPFAMQWKNTVEAGLVYDKPVSSLDIFATLAELSGSPTNPEKPLDGTNLIPFLTGENSGQPHEAIYLRKFDQDRHVVRQGDYKLIYLNTTGQKLYNISTNISEEDSLNLYSNEDYYTKRMKLDSMLSEWETGLIHPRFLGLLHDELVWATQVNLSDTSIELNIDDTKLINATIIPQDAFTDTLEWSSNNESVATVDKNGLITAHADGFALIIATVTDLRQITEQCLVKVGTPAVATEISLSQDSIILLPGKTAELVATVNSSANSNFAIEWSTSNPSLATVNENGYIIMHKEGAVNIKATVIGNENISAICKINGGEKDETSSTIDALPNGLDDVFIYPNPITEGQLTMKLNSNFRNATITIYNAASQIKQIRKLDDTDTALFDISTFENGVYLFTISANKQMISKKVVVSN